MKKFLLFAFAAVMAVSASAQQKFDKSVVFNRPTQKYAPMALTSDIKVSDFAKPDFKSLATKKSMKKANEYGLTAASFDKTGWIEVEEGEICNQTGTVTFAYNEDGSLTVSDLCFGFATVQANFDEDNLKLVIPGGQYCYEHAQYGRMSIYAIELDLAAGVFNFLADETGQMPANITYTLDVENGVFMPDGQFVIYMEDFAEQGGQNPYWSFGLGSPLKAPNAIQMYEFNAARGAGWEEKQTFAYVEDWGFSVNIDNFIDISTVGMDVDSETNTLTMATGQPLQDISYGMSEAELATYGPTLHVVGTVLDGRSIYISDEVDAVNLKFYNGQTVYTDDIFVAASNFDNDGMGYIYGYVEQYTLYLMQDGAQFDGFNPEIWDGIVDLTKFKKAGEGKKFNLMGQQINRAHKGIMVSDGKKYLRK